MKCLDQFISVRLCCNETQAVGMTASDWPVSHVVKRVKQLIQLSFTEIAVSGLILQLKAKALCSDPDLKASLG